MAARHVETGDQIQIILQDWSQNRRRRLRRLGNGLGVGLSRVARTRRLVFCRNEAQEAVGRLATGFGVVAVKPIQTGAGMGIEDGQCRVFLLQMAQDGDQNSVFEHIGMIAGMEGVAVTEHGGMVTRKIPPALCVCPSA